LLFVLALGDEERVGSWRVAEGLDELLSSVVQVAFVRKHGT
jgi:hypothetical protein